jgi:hypothetical protein
MYSVIQDRGAATQEVIWEGESRSVADQKFNAHKNSCEQGDFDVLEIIRFRDDGEPQVERTFRFRG